MRRILFSFIFLFIYHFSYSQLIWQNVDSLYQPLPKGAHVYFTNDKIDTGTFKAYYFIADIKDKHLNFTTDTSYKRRLTPFQFYQKNNYPLAVVNSAFFSFDRNKSLNLVVKDGRLIEYNSYSLKNTGIDSSIKVYPFRSAIGITKHRKADIAWTYTDPSLKYPRASETVVKPINSKDKIASDQNWYLRTFKKWKVNTGIGGGPMLLQNGEIFITNEEERMFTGKGLTDKHPRTAIGYTKDNKLIILVVEGRSESGAGASLVQEAQIFKDLGCVEAFNLDGGGSSCLLINGKETIKPSDKEGERAVPAVFIIKTRK